MAKSKFMEYVLEDVQKYKGIAVPVRAGLPERLLVRKAAPQKLHANPDDEFTDPAIGPNDEIIARYVRDIQEAQFHGTKEIFQEPLTIQKIRPGGYMLLNGHHRWAAAIRMNLKSVPVKIENPTTLADVEKMLKSARNARRVTLDLDEIVFQSDPAGACEKGLFFPLNHIYRENVHLGIPALFHFLRSRGYDVWVFSSKAYSTDYIRSLFRAYRAGVDGIITGGAHRSEEDRKRIESLLAAKYSTTIHVDRDSLLRTDSGSKDFQESDLSGPAESWSRRVMEAIEVIQKDERK